MRTSRRPSDSGNIILNIAVSLFVSAAIGASLLPSITQALDTLDASRFRSNLRQIKAATEYAYFVACPYGPSTSPTYPPPGNCAATSFPANGFQAIANEGLIPQNALTAYSMGGAGNNTLTVQGASVTLAPYSNGQWTLTVTCPAGAIPNLCLAVSPQFPEASYNAGTNAMTFYVSAVHLPTGGQWGFWGNESLGQIPLPVP